jgi:hypothetical protein
VLKDILGILNKNDFSEDKLLDKWSKTCVKSNIYVIDFELIRIYRRFVDVGALDPYEHRQAREWICEMNMPILAKLLQQKFNTFSQKVLDELTTEQGNEILQAATQAIFKNVQLKLFEYVEA